MKISIEEFRGYTTKERLISLPSYFLEVIITLYPKNEIRYVVTRRSMGNYHEDSLGIVFKTLSDAIDYINKIGEE